MDIFDFLTLVGGLCLFLFGMNVMGQALERRAGDQLRTILGKLTNNQFLGFLTGLAVTAVIQSSSATTVMVVGFVNSSLLTLRQAIGVIMGANVGTTVTAWILSLSGIESGNLLVQLLKPTSFTPVLALVGIILYMFCKSSKKKETGLIFLGFATLMFGMDTMSGAVAGLKDVPAFQQMFLVFQNPILGVLAGAVLTAIIQSSSASVGILQALAVTGQVTYAAAIPIIMGQNIGTCVTAMLSSIGTTKNARRAALIHLSFNILGTAVWLTVFSIVKVVVQPAFLGTSASLFGIAVAHSVFNILCTALLMPMGGLLEKLAIFLVPDSKAPEAPVTLDERLLVTPSIALEQSHQVAANMAACAAGSISDAIRCLDAYTPELAAAVRKAEDQTDKYEDMLGTYLVKLSSQKIGDDDSREAAMLLKLIGDFERISDHSVNIVESAEEMARKGLHFSPAAKQELKVLTDAVQEILSQSLQAFQVEDPQAATSVEPLEQVIDQLKETLRTHHILRLQQGLCTIDVGFVWSDLLTNLERVSDHCSNIAGSLLDLQLQNMNTHAHLRSLKYDSNSYQQLLDGYMEKYSV